MNSDEFDPKKELVKNMNYALSCRVDLINKYDVDTQEKENQDEMKWINHVRQKMSNGWVPDYGEVSLEVNKTIEFGLRLRRKHLIKVHPKITNIEYSKESSVIHVDFKKILDDSSKK